jgi:hypothetical protein
MTNSGPSVSDNQNLPHLRPFSLSITKNWRLFPFLVIADANSLKSGIFWFYGAEDTELTTIQVLLSVELRQDNGIPLIPIKISSTGMSLPIDEERLNADTNITPMSQTTGHDVRAEILMENWKCQNSQADHNSTLKFTKITVTPFHRLGESTLWNLLAAGTSINELVPRFGPFWL